MLLVELVDFGLGVIGACVEFCGVQGDFDAGFDAGDRFV